jgi:hypothetical protein
MSPNPAKGMQHFFTPFLWVVCKFRGGMLETPPRNRVVLINLIDLLPRGTVLANRVA